MSLFIERLIAPIYYKPEIQLLRDLNLSLYWGLQCVVKQIFKKETH
jgi:hypothetical protein